MSKSSSDHSGVYIRSFSFRASDTTYTDSPICIVSIQIANNKLGLENFHFNFYFPHNTIFTSHHDNKKLPRWKFSGDNQNKWNAEEMWWTASGSRNRTAFEWSAAWLDLKEEMCWDCLQIQRFECSGWSLLESGGILQRLQLSCGRCPSLHHWKKGKLQEMWKSLSKQPSPNLSSQSVFSCHPRASLLITKENWGSHVVLLGCWASPNFGMIPSN